MKKANKFQTVKDVIELIERIPRWQVETKVHFVEGDDPNLLCKHIWIGSIEEFKRVVPKIFYDLRISSYKQTNVDIRFYGPGTVEYLISIDTKYYGFGSEELRQFILNNKQILSSTEDIIEVQTAKRELDRIDTWSRKLAEESNLSPYNIIADRVKFDEIDENGISENRRFICAIEKTINAKNKEIKR